MCVSSCVRLRVAVLWTRSYDPKPVTGDPDPIQICVRCGFDTLPIRRPTHEMIQRSILVRAVKTRRRIGSKIVSFHVSIYSYVFSYLLSPVGNCVSIRIISCDRLIYFIGMITWITL